ncbi:MAG: hypothetical protein GXY58_17675 [Planctomycetaceae bacterium]|nr:hypothetical protein [Planctomycetaceae bacterium]
MVLPMRTLWNTVLLGACAAAAVIESPAQALAAIGFDAPDAEAYLTWDECAWVDFALYVLERPVVAVDVQQCEWLDFALYVLEIDVNRGFLIDGPESLLVIEASASGESPHSPPSSELESLALASHAPAGMLPSSSVHSGGPSAGGWGLASELPITPQNSPGVALSPESRAVLPAGPVFRWFRPPREWL